MRFRYSQVLLLFAVVACLTSFAAADNHVQLQNQPVQDDSILNLKESALRHLRRNADSNDDTANEERGKLSVIKSKFLFKKPSNLAKVKQLFGENADINKIQIAAGQKVDITKLKTPSGKTVDLTKVKLKTTPVKEADITKMKKLAEQDPDLRSIGSVVGKSPTQLSAKQVTDVQSFIKKHPEEGLHIIDKMLLGAFGVFFLFLAAGLVIVVAT
ncbi:hypothetical protein PI124_g12557 [Phytophthora idaei]|nr:hypothetical protein PI125_g12094 [Phytophthora idaei]KAG3172283.1 hypothetical protein PI126_g1450 [Phytophthora idaei]KAG3242626.1 hypothetical protein PI124_g12557 [Phytophthora idaei]